MRLIDADTENERLIDFIAQNDSAIKYAIEHKDMTMLEDIFCDYFEGQATANCTCNCTGCIHDESVHCVHCMRAYSDCYESI